ncbi:hypothetical protein, partial [Micromonospora sp. MH33]|uniref:hypothetical protein n=1 Tax=Micromonospora sp. MH33 TaxID=1945509 RepID=UPI001AF00DE8
MAGVADDVVAAEKGIDLVVAVRADAAPLATSTEPSTGLCEDVLAFEESFGAARRAQGGRRAAGELAAMDSCDSARAAVVHGHRAVA